MKQNHVVLKPGKDKAIRNKHHWIFSGAIQSLPHFQDGDILQVRSSGGEHLGYAYFNRKANIIGRMLSFDERSAEEVLQKNLLAAFQLRSELFDGDRTNAYRLVNAEGDFIPGLIVDRYKDVLVVQISTLGMEKLKSLVVQELLTLSKKILKIDLNAIFEQSELPSRKEEGLTDARGFLYGEEKTIENLEVKENGLQFIIPVGEGQKTGFFLDHREMRHLVSTFAKDKHVLNCFAYTGAFSVYALAGGASKVDTVEISEKALDIAKKNLELNGYDPKKQGMYCEDVFDFLRQRELPYELIILDPPAFAKKQKDVIKACRGYKDINRVAMQKMPPKSLLLTCSCSFHVDEELFQKVVFQASVEAKRKVRIIGRHQMAADHPVNICHPESDYLKSLFLYVE